MLSSTVVGISGVSVRYGRTLVLDDVSLDVNDGDIIAVRGANGAGKTTLLRVLVNAFNPRSGKRSGPRHSAYVPATITPPSITAGAWLALMRRSNRSDPLGHLDRLGFDGSLTASCRSLSFGNLRKLLLAEALSSGESLIVIDEASVGLDDRGLVGLEAMVNETHKAGCAVVLADQNSRPIPGALRTITIADAKLHVTDGYDDQVEITLRGPENRKTEFLAVCEDHGFLPLDERS